VSFQEEARFFGLTEPEMEVSQVAGGDGLPGFAHAPAHDSR